jgi:hypothetical protein
VHLPTAPISDCYGYDRGTPVDRHYIETFLAEHAHTIRGDGAEIKDDTYLRRFGGEALLSATVIDIDPANPRASRTADLAEPASLPANAFDCVVLTQTLQLVQDPAIALANCARALRVDGALLVTVPALGRISPSAPNTDRWRYTPAGLRQMFAPWPGPATVKGRGNLRTCIAALVGEAVEDLTPADLADDDSAFPLVTCAIAVRSHACPGFPAGFSDELACHPRKCS